MVRASAKSLELRSLNSGLFAAGMDLMRRESALARAKVEKEPAVKSILIASARASHRQYLKSLKRAAGIQHAMQTRLEIDDYTKRVASLVLQTMEC